MSAKPIISWLKADGSPLSKIQYSSDAAAFASVTADTESLQTTFLIANNYTKGAAAATAVSDATSCYIKVTDVSGGTESPVVKEQWMSAKCGNDSTFHKLGVTLDGTGAVTSELKLDVAGGDGTVAKTITGAANDGTLANAGHNVATITSFVKPPLTTTADGGLQQFRVVLVYVYGAV